MPRVHTTTITSHTQTNVSYPLWHSWPLLELLLFSRSCCFQLLYCFLSYLFFAHVYCSSFFAFCPWGGQMQPQSLFLMVFSFQHWHCQKEIIEYWYKKSWKICICFRLGQRECNLSPRPSPRYLPFHLPVHGDSCSCRKKCSAAGCLITELL